MVKNFPNLFLIFVLLIVALACVAPGFTTPDTDLINTAIAGTHAAALTRTAQFGIPITGLSLTPTMTRAASATPFPTFTLVVLGVPRLRVSEDTICRTGPGEVYDRVGVLRVGELADVVGRSADGNYWVIRNPDRVGETCWISGQNAILTGLIGILPVFAVPPTPTPTPTNTRIPSSTPTHTPTPSPTSTPSRTPTRTPTPSFTPISTFTSSIPTASPTITPTSTLTSSTPTSSATMTATPTSTPTSSSTPTPTSSFTPTSTPSPTATLPPGFTASFSGLESCTGTGWWADLELENTGGLVFESMFVILSDTATGTVLPLTSEDFTNRDGCSTTDTQSNLPPATTRIVSLPVFTYNPSGHPLSATIVLCSNAALGGTCMTQTINFTP